MERWDEVLRTLSDDPDDYERVEDLVFLSRQGRSHELMLREIPGQGLSVVLPDGDAGQHAPIATYVQRDILDLPRLARQITKALEKTDANRPGGFVQGPAQAVIDGASHDWPEVGTKFAECLTHAVPGATRFVQLMAPAGQGKTMLLEKTSISTAAVYQPEPFPTPILLTIDLLGRYVGTIDDAIAGSLNNTYIFLGLNQKDVALCLRKRWIVLGLDGFDELVARVGVRDAFSRINELLDQLCGSGTIIVSARESFFELYEISSGIRNYLQPRVGSYATSTIKLLPWGERQASRFFATLESKDPDEDVAQLLQTFGGDESIVLHPFFLTRLADLWVKGERFTGAADETGTLARMRFVIETFIRRESQEKWVDRNQNPFLTIEGHTDLLGGIAEEMWRSGAFRLDKEELRLAGEMGLAQSSVSEIQLKGALERLPTHGALTVMSQRYGFVHDQFFFYFLGYQLSRLLQTGDDNSVIALLSARELSPDALEWVEWFTRPTAGQSGERTVKKLCELASMANEPSADLNISNLVGRLVRELEGTSLAHLTFVGSPFRPGTQHQGLEFHQCRFWNTDLSSVEFSDCIFRDCVIGDIRIDYSTKLNDCVFDDSPVASIEIRDSESLYAPEQIEERLRALGASLRSSKREAAIKAERTTSQEVSRCVERFVKASQSTCDVAVEDIEAISGKLARKIVRIALNAGVLKEVSKGVSGPKRTFVRFCVDRTLLLRGQARRTGDEVIDRFWTELARA